MMLRELAGELEGMDVVVLGNSGSMKDLDLAALTSDGVTSAG